MISKRQRIDQLLVVRGFADSRHRAQALLLAGQVLVNEQKLEKPGRLVDPDASIRILSQMPFVSRAGAKLKAALEYFTLGVSGLICADLGASTGGFTDCLLQSGATAVHAYDVGVTQLDWKLRSDPRVVVHEKSNVRYLKGEDLPDDLSLVVADLSFISLTKVLVPIRDALQKSAAQQALRAGGHHIDIVTLVKPQFEVGRGEVGKGGIVRDEALRLAALDAVGEFAMAAGYSRLGSMPSPILGAKGNREFFLHLRFIPGLSSNP